MIIYIFLDYIMAIMHVNSSNYAKCFLTTFALNIVDSFNKYIFYSITVRNLALPMENPSK